jgi:hypothetical protein
MSTFARQLLTGRNRVRWLAAAVIAVVLLLGIGGAGVARLRSGITPLASAVNKPSTCGDAYRLLSLRPSEINAAKAVCLDQSLKFTGELAGTVAEGYTVGSDTTNPTSMCIEPKRWNGYPQALLAIVIGAKAYRLRIAAPGGSEHQAVTINNLANVVDLAAISNPSTGWSQASGTVVLNPDGVTGTIDASLSRDAAGAQPVHVSGQWACGAPLPLPTFDASLPCSSFYAVNHLHDADVARMKAGACHASDLTFKGGINTHLEHTITDSVSPHPGTDGDNFCGAIGEDYTSALKFSIGDESFLLDLNVRRYPAVVPGEYPAGVTLWLGHADPDNQGLFVTDDKVFWSGNGGTLTLGADMKSGTLDATMAGLVSFAGNGVEVHGSWRCGA